MSLAVHAQPSVLLEGFTDAELEAELLVRRETNTFRVSEFRNENQRLRKLVESMEALLLRADSALENCGIGKSAPVRVNIKYGVTESRR